MKKKLQKYIPKGEFSRNVLTLMTGSTIAQAIPIAISPILTRLYTPEDFGIFALYMSIASIFSTIATGRYELAIMLPKNEKEAINLVVLSLFLTLIISAFSLIFIIIFNKQILYLLNNSEIQHWLYFIPLTVLFTGLYQTFNYWINREKKYKKLAVAKILNSSNSATIKLGLGSLNIGSMGLLYGQLTGQTIATGYLGSYLWKNNKKNIDYIEKKIIKKLAKEYKKLPIYNLPNALIDSFRLSGINILVAKYFSTFILGNFSFAWKIVQTPMGLIGSSISQVFYQKIASTDINKLYPLVIKFIKKAVILSFPIFVMIYFFSEAVFTFVFGQKWEIAGKAASVLTPWLFLNFITSPLSMLYIYLNKQDVLLIFSIAYMSIPLILIFIFKGFSFLFVLNIISIAMSVMLLIFIALILLIIRNQKL